MCMGQSLAFGLFPSLFLHVYILSVYNIFMLLVQTQTKYKSEHLQAHENFANKIQGMFVDFISREKEVY